MNERSRAIVALAALALIWGFNWIVMKVAVAYAAPFTFAAWRTLGGGIALVLVAIAMRKSLRPAHPMPYVWIGLFQTAGFVGLVTWAVVSAGAGQVAMLAYTMPFFVALLGAAFLRERMTLLQGIAVAVAFGGVACMVGPLRSSMLSDVLAVAAGLSWAVGVVLAKRLNARERVDSFDLTLWQMLFGGAALALVALVLPGHATHWTPLYAGALLYNIILATALAYVLWLFVLRVLPARDASMGTLANPVVGVLGAWLLLGETPTLLESIGMAAVVAGLAVLSFGGRTARE